MSLLLIVELEAQLKRRDERIAELEKMHIAIDRAWANYERFGETCVFEGNSMIYASTLEDIYKASHGEEV